MEEREILILVCGNPEYVKVDIDANTKEIRMAITVVAYVDVETGEFKKENRKLFWTMDLENKLAYKFEDKKIYKIRAEINPYVKEILLKEILQRNCHEKRLDDLVCQFKANVYIKFKGKEYILNRAQDAFVTVMGIGESNCVIQLKVDEPYGEEPYKSLKTWEKLLSGKAPFLKKNKNCWLILLERYVGIIEFERKAKEYAATELMEAFNSWGRLKNGKEAKKITKQDVMENIRAVCIMISDSKFEIFYDTGGLMLEHTVRVCGDVENGFNALRFVE